MPPENNWNIFIAPYGGAAMDHAALPSRFARAAAGPRRAGTGYDGQTVNMVMEIFVYDREKVQTQQHASSQSRSTSNL